MVKYKINKFYFVKNQVSFAILLIFGFSFLVYLFSFNVNAAKVESGVTINPPSPPTAPTAGTCGLQIISGVPINYGQLNVSQVSAEQKVTIKNVGTAPAKVLVSAGDWIGGTSANPIKLYGPEITRVAVSPGMEFAKKIALHKDVTTTLGDLGPGVTGETFWSLYADPKLSGSPHQDVAIDLNC
jgi:hypothetical protein